VAELVQVGTGRNADVFALGDGRVLRRYRDGGDVAAEAAVMTYVAGHGYPVPLVHAASGPDLVMDQVDGPTMLDAVLAGGMDAEAAGTQLAELHRRLHALPPRLGREPGDAILHLDLHPANVMLGPRGPVVIDWRNAAEGPAGLDVAVSAVILAQAAVDDRLPDLAGPARSGLAAFLRQAGGDPASLLGQAVAQRQDDRSLTAADKALLGPAETLIRQYLGGRR
jgi:streptomycin 6-kinase